MVLRNKLHIGKPAFFVNATLLNQLSITMTSSETINTFRTKLKTYLFEITFSPQVLGGSVLQWQRLPVPVYD